MIIIYILLLEQEKYYIGRTNNTEFRVNQHFNQDGSEWTKLYKPIKTIEIIENCNEFDEDKYTLMYMNIYGIENVRGGSFCQIKLLPEIKNIIQLMIKTATNKCYNCGNSGHYANECSQNNNILLGLHTNRDIHEFKFEYKPYQQKVYEMCVKTLSENEYIIKKIGEYDEYNGRYRINYLTNYGNLVIGDFDNKRKGSSSSAETTENNVYYSKDFTIRAYMWPINNIQGTSSNRPSGYTRNFKLFNNRPYSDKIIKNLIKKEFKSAHPSVLNKEISAYVNTINSIEE